MHSTASKPLQNEQKSIFVESFPKRSSKIIYLVAVTFGHLRSCDDKKVIIYDVIFKQNMILEIPRIQILVLKSFCSEKMIFLTKTKLESKWGLLKYLSRTFEAGVHWFESHFVDNFFLQEKISKLWLRLCLQKRAFQVEKRSKKIIKNGLKLAILNKL